MNDAGDRIAVGGHENDGSASRAGHARVYFYNGSAWVQLGADIDGEGVNDRFGRTISLNAAGDRVAIGAGENDGTANNAGHVRVFSYNGSHGHNSAQTLTVKRRAIISVITVCK